MPRLRSRVRLQCSAHFQRWDWVEAKDLAASFDNLASDTSSVKPSDGNNDVTVSKENGCDNKTEQPDASKEAEKTEAPKKDDNVEGSEETKNTTKDEQPKQSDKDDQVKDAEKDDLTKDTDKDEAQTMFSDSESTRGKGRNKKGNRNARGGNRR